MVSTASTVIMFWTPDTLRLVQWPVITILLEMPLMLMALWLQATVRFSLMPEMVRLALAGAVGAALGDVAGAGEGVCAALGDGAGAALLAETLGVLGVGERITIPPRECRSALFEMRATTPNTKKGNRTHNSRAREGDLGNVPGNGRP